MDFFSIRPEQSVLPYPLQTTKQDDAEDKSAGLVQVHGVPDDKLPVKKQLIIADAVKLVRVKE